MKKLLAAILFFATLSVVHAQGGFVGATATGILSSFSALNGTTETMPLFVGAQVGSYDLIAGGFGARLSADAGIGNSAGLFQGEADLITSFGQGLKLYAGAGVGYIAASGSGSIYASGLAGVDFGILPHLGTFLELQARYYPTGAVTAIPIRLGVNYYYF